MLAVIASSVGLVTLADLFGLLDLPQFTSRVPLITLLLVCMILGHQALELTHALRTVELGVADVQLNRFRSLRDRLDHEMVKVFGDHVSELIQNVNSAVEQQKIHVDDMDHLFRYFYIKTLKAYPGREFVATSKASRDYFWKDDSVETAIAEFTRRKGKMKRIFFFRCPHGVSLSVNHLSEEERRIVARQLEIGVEVYGTTRIPRHLEHFFFTESTGLLAWTAELKQDSQMKAITASSNQAVNLGYVDNFKELLLLPDTHRIEFVSNTTKQLAFVPVPVPRRRVPARARPPALDSGTSPGSDPSP